MKEPDSVTGDEPPAMFHFRDEFFSRDDRYSIGIEEESGRHYLSIPVTNGIADYEEYYELTARQYTALLGDPRNARMFAQRCRRRERDDLLIQMPGSNRGTAV